MHEVALAQSIVEIVREQTKGQTFGAVTRVFLRIGALSSVEPEALVFGFDSAARGTVADGARLEIVRTPGTAFCAACGRDVQVAARIDDCPACGSAQLLITGGDELRVTELEVA